VSKAEKTQALPVTPSAGTKALAYAPRLQAEGSAAAN
jgi:hypothetical protein